MAAPEAAAVARFFAVALHGAGGVAMKCQRDFERCLWEAQAGVGARALQTRSPPSSGPRGL
eukprot:945-Pyramimonas_sp.AAC.1